MADTKKINGKETLKWYLNVMVSNGNPTEEIINTEEVDSLVDELRLYLSDENNIKLGKVNNKYLEMFSYEFGLDDNGDYNSLENVALKFETTDRRARQAEVMCLRQLLFFRARRDWMKTGSLVSNHR